MRKYLPLALATTAIVATQIAIAFTRDHAESIVRADDIELIHVDSHAVMINMTVMDGARRTTIAFTPAAAIEAQQGLGQTIVSVLSGAEALRAQQQSPAPVP